MNKQLAIAAILALASTAQSQVTITSKDMFNSIGQSYRAYANKPPGLPFFPPPDDGSGDGLPPLLALSAQPLAVDDGAEADVSGAIGETGGPQTWDFTTGPDQLTYRFDYVSPAADGVGDDFPNAKLAERKTTESSGAKSWLFFDQVVGTGRRVFGFYDESFSADQPSTPFTAPIVDFPDPIKMGSTWTTSTSFKTQVIGIDTIIDYSSTDTVDAFGIVILPGLGFGDCLRVNEVAKYETRVDVFGDGNYQSLSTDYIRNYYWLRPDHGIVAQITSSQQSAPPPENLTTAYQFVRMFEINHPVTELPPETIKGLKISLGKKQVLINWTKSPTLANYTVEVTENPADSTSWKPLASTASNFVLDTNLDGVGTRFYRISGKK